jgi:hypothetical protein
LSFSARAKEGSGREIEDEPGAEGRFLSGVRKALEMPHKPHKAPAGKKPNAKQGKPK